MKEQVGKPEREGKRGCLGKLRIAGNISEYKVCRGLQTYKSKNVESYFSER